MSGTKGKKVNGISRRNFLQTAGAAGLGSLLLASGARADSCDAHAKKGSGKLPHRAFGKTGEEVCSLSLGGQVDYTQNQLLLKRALNLGVDYWDTATGYSSGKSEEGIGMFFEKNPDVRKKIFLVTKSGQRSAGGLDREFNRSLERMKIDSVDLFFFWYIENINDVDRDEMRAWAEKKKKEKKIRFIGLSSHKRMAPVLMGASKLGWLDALMCTYNYRIMHDDDMKKAVDACKKANIGITAMKTQGGGPITDSKADRKLGGHFVKKGYIPEQAKVKAVLENSQISAVCSLMPTIEILESNVAAVMDKTKLDASDWRALDRHAAATCGTTCAACGRCEKAVAGSVPVSNVMRYLMYSRGYGDTAEARAYFRQLPGSVRARLATVDFRKAERVCPQSLPIGRLMKEAVLELA
jgi:predicted aldo/keto reductase-like oxidoreductase